MFTTEEERNRSRAPEPPAAMTYPSSFGRLVRTEGVEQAIEDAGERTVGDELSCPYQDRDILNPREREHRPDNVS